MQDGRNVVLAVERCIDILEYVANRNEPVSVKEVAEKLNIPIASCFRIIRNLVDREYLEKSSSAADQYTLGMSILGLAEKKSRMLDLRSIARPDMNKLANVTNQTVQLGRLDNRGVIYIEQALPMTPISVLGALFTPLNINVSASGKVLCAFLPTYEQAAYVEQAHFAKMTDKSIMDKTEFKKQLIGVREKWFAIDREEYSIGVGCLAMPLFDYNEKCVGSLGLTGNIGDYTDESSLENLLSNLRAAAKSISLKMGSTLCYK